MIALWLVASSARAQDTGAQSVTARREAADTSMRAGRPADAAPMYRALYDETHDAALLYNLGQAQYTMGRFADAYATYRKFQAEAAPALLGRVPQLQSLIDDVRSRVTKLAVHCNVNGAQVLVGGRALGVIPVSDDTFVVAGSAAPLEVRAEGYAPWTRMLELPAGGLASIEVQLIAVERVGTLVVSTSVARATLQVDDAIFGPLPAVVALGPGSHALTVSSEGYPPSRKFVNVEPGDRREVSIPLEHDEPITKKWWFWTGVGAVVLGGATLAIVATREKSADVGTLAPGRLPAALSF